MLGRRVGDGIGARGISRDRAVVDDPAAHRRLGLHDADRFLGTDEGAGQVHVDDLLPGLDRQILHVDGRGTHAGVIEQHVEATELVLGRGEQRRDGLGIDHVGRVHEHFTAGAVRHGRGLLEFVLAAPGKRDVIALLLQRQRGGPADATARPRDKRNLAGHDAFSLSRSSACDSRQSVLNRAIGLRPW